MNHYLIKKQHLLIVISYKEHQINYIQIKSMQIHMNFFNSTQRDIYFQNEIHNPIGEIKKNKIEFLYDNN